MDDPATKMWKQAQGVTWAAMTHTLQSAGSAEDILQGVAAGHALLDDAMFMTLKGTGWQVACAAGCSFCCWLRIDVRAHDVFLLVRELRSQLDAAGLENLISRVDHAREHPGTVPCPLLGEGGKCSVYTARPATCRRYFSNSVDACRTVQQGGQPEPFEYGFLNEMGRWTAMGTSNALIAAGYDGYVYKLNAALYEALTDPSCEQRWVAREKAFSVEAESPLPSGGSQTMVVERLRRELREANPEVNFPT